MKKFLLANLAMVSFFGIAQASNFEEENNNALHPLNKGITLAKETPEETSNFINITFSSFQCPTKTELFLVHACFIRDFYKNIIVKESKILTAAINDESPESVEKVGTSVPISSVPIYKNAHEKYNNVVELVRLYENGQKSSAWLGIADMYPDMYNIKGNAFSSFDKLERSVKKKIASCIFYALQKDAADKRKKRTSFLDNKVIDLRTKLGVMYYNLGKEKKAKKQLEIAGNNSPEPLTALGVLHCGNHMYKSIPKAIECFKAAINLDKDSYALFKLGELYFHQQQYENSIYYLELALNSTNEQNKESAGLFLIEKNYQDDHKKHNEQTDEEFLLELETLLENK